MNDMIKKIWKDHLKNKENWKNLYYFQKIQLIQVN